MDGTHIKVRIVFLDHLLLVLLPKLGLPLVAIVNAPLPPRFAHFPICANHRVTVAAGVVAPKQRKDEHKGSTRVCVHNTDPTKAIGRWKVAWEAAKIQASVQCRFHDLRHTGCTRMLEAGVPFSVVASIMGWSASTTVRMAKRYGHIGDRAQRLAVDALCEPLSEGDVAQNRPQARNITAGARAN